MKLILIILGILILGTSSSAGDIFAKYDYENCEETVIRTKIELNRLSKLKNTSDVRKYVKIFVKKNSVFFNEYSGAKESQRISTTRKTEKKDEVQNSILNRLIHACKSKYGLKIYKKYYEQEIYRIDRLFEKASTEAQSDENNKEEAVSKNVFENFETITKENQ